MKAKIVFMGTPLFATNVLQGLIDNYEVIMVVCQPDKPVGRKRVLTACPIKQLAIENDIKVFQPEKLKENYEEIVSLNPDLIVTCAYGQIVPKELLDIPKYGCINVHASLLPEYRGASPISEVLIDGRKTTGVTIMYMDETLDTGDIISKKEIDISSDDNLETLSSKLSLIGKELLLNTIPDILDGTNDRIKQDNNLATYTHMIKREDETIDFNASGIAIVNKIRGLYPSASFKIDGIEIKVLSATFEEKKQDMFGIISVVDKNSFGISCKDGIIYLQSIKPAGKNVMSIKDFLNGIKKENYLNKRVD